jgi:hypothetical protein
MTALTAMQAAAIRLVGRKPGTFFTSSDQFEMEMVDLANEVAIDIAKYQDWQALISLASVNGDGTATEFALPSDYDRMLINADIQDLNGWFWGYCYVANLNAFLRAQEQGWGAWPGGWTIYGNKLRFSAAPAATDSATYPYITKNLVMREDAVPKEAFTADADTFRLPERLLTLGLVWRWRENKKLDASGDQEAFIKALDEYAAKDKGSRIMRWKAGAGRFAGARLAWPWELG